MSAPLSGNDLVPIEVPTVGGDTDIWGTELNTKSFTQLAKAVYASREDRSISILGGGKISWNQSGNALTFTEDIIIRDHITDKTVTITTAASPVTLDAANKVAYVEKNRGPASNQSINAATVVAAGALPNTKDANGMIVLFHRTSDGTILVPWARRELLDGDNWQWGMALSWFERLASARKPSYRTLAADDSQVICPASATSPAVVIINGKLYANVANETMDLDTAGRNGLDTGTKAANTAYYLYAIPATSGRGFDIVASTTPPTGAGPSGFTSAWSYIGAFATEETGSGTIWPFQASCGVYISDEEFEAETHTGDTNSTAKVMNSIPLTVKQLYGHVAVNPGTAGQSCRVTGVQSTTNDGIVVNGPVAGQTTRGYGFVHIFTAQTVYITVSNAAATGTWNLMGWREDPMEYQ